MANTGEFTLGSGNIIGGIGSENSWPVTITAGSYPSAGCVIPAVGNTNNGIQVRGGGSTNSGMWRKFTGLDYRVTLDVAIWAGGTLTIEDGVHVLFDYHKYINVGGHLVAIGTPGMGILFTQSTTHNWYGLLFSGSGSCDLEYCAIEYANYGVIASSSGILVAGNTTFQNCGYGIDANSGLVQLIGSTITGNDCGIHGDGGTVEFQHCEIINNNDYGIYLVGATPIFGADQSEWNDIYGNGSENLGRDLHNGTTDIEVRWVYWGTMDHSEILDHVWDLHDQASLGLVRLTPFSDDSHSHASAVEENPGFEGAVPAMFALHQNVPNPFNPQTRIVYELAAAENVHLNVYDLTGRLVRNLVQDHQVAGRYESIWDGQSNSGQTMASGIYVVRLQAGRHVHAMRATLLK